MKIPLICPACMREDIASAAPFTAVEFRDDGRYEVACPRGHSATVLLQQQKFELLFDIGAYAITDGYYREAVSTFAAGLERCCEFFIRAMLFQRGTLAETSEQAWRAVAAQSERQLGAFVFLYSVEFNRPPSLLSNPLVKFRNEVVHKGRIPTRSEALDFGQNVLTCMRQIVRDAQERFPEGVQRTVFAQLSQSRTPADANLATGTLTIPTIVSLSIADSAHHHRSLDEAVRGLRRWQV